MLARLSLLAVALVAIALATWFWLRPDSAGADVFPHAAQAPTHAESLQVAAPADTPQAPVTPQRSVVAAETTPPPATALASAVTKPRLLLQGTVSLLDARNRELEPVDGTIVIAGWLEPLSGNATFSKAGEWTATVSAGTWKLQIETGDALARLSIARVEAGGKRLALVSPGDFVHLPLQGDLAVVARRPDPVVLRVTDAASGNELDTVCLVSSANWWDHPGLAFSPIPQLCDVRSPVALPAAICQAFMLGSDCLLVGAAGYAWVRADLDFGLGGERVVALQPGCGLELEVRGPPPPKAMLRFYSESAGGGLLELPLESGRTVALQGLPAGELQIKAELGEWYAETADCGSALVTLVPGRTVSAILELTEAPRAELASVSGRVFVPKSWQAEQAVVSLELLDADLGVAEASQIVRIEAKAASEADCDVFAWSFAPVQSGRHKLELFQPRFSMLIDVPPGATRGLELRVPEPVTLQIRLVDADSGDALGAVDLSWAPVCKDDESGRTFEAARFERATGLHEIRAPSGWIDVGLFGFDYEILGARIDARQAGPPQTLRCQRACGMDLLLRDVDTAVQWEGWLEVIPVDGAAGEMKHWVGVAHGRRITMTAPGTYGVQPPKIAGYKQPPLQRIPVRAGEFTQHVIQLEREH